MTHGLLLVIYFLANSNLVEVDSAHTLSERPSVGPVETQVEYIQPASHNEKTTSPEKHQRYSIEIIHLVTDFSTEDMTAEEILTRMGEHQKGEGDGYQVAKLTTFENVTCQRRHGYEAAADRSGKILTRRFIRPGGETETTHSDEKWIFIGDEVSVCPFLNSQSKLSIKIHYEETNLSGKQLTTPVLSDDSTIRRQLNTSKIEIETSIAVEEDQWLPAGRMVVTSQEVGPNGKNSNFHKENLVFVKVTAIAQDQ